MFEQARGRCAWPRCAARWRASAHCGLFDASKVDAIAARVTVVPEADAGAALSSALVIFEGVPEVLDLKREVLARASRAGGPAADHRLDHLDHPGR